MLGGAGLVVWHCLNIGLALAEEDTWVFVNVSLPSKMRPQSKKFDHLLRSPANLLKV